MAFNTPQKTDDFDDLLTFHLVPQTCQMFTYPVKYLNRRIAKFGTDIHGSQINYPQVFLTTPSLLLWQHCMG